MKFAGLDATYSIGDGLSGVGVYSREILYGLAAAHPEQRFDFWYRGHRYLEARKQPAPGNVRRKLLSGPLGPRGEGLFHGLNQRLPGTLPRRSVATFHDLFVLTGEYSTREFRERFAAQARDAAQRADAVIAVSAFTAEQVIGLLGVERAKVRVVHHGVRRFTEGSPTARERVILNVGAIQKRKNIARLVKAFESVDREWRLVLAGSDGYGAQEIRDRIAASPARDRIVAPGYVSTGELASWYRRAGVFAFPSLDEGFGMPVLEAMAAGVPVLTSSRSALPEVAGDAALLADPEDGDAVTAGLQRITEDAGLRAELVARGLVRASEFTWDRAVAETWRVYREIW
jgi:glycosyltransferase involved in cell wall biosynthesis